MTRTLLLVVSLAASAPVALHAQAIVKPAAPLDGPRARVRDALLLLRDSLIVVNSSAARLQRDFQATSAAALSGHSRQVAAACSRSARVIPRTRQAVSAARAGTPPQAREQAALLRGLDSLSGTMGRCAADFAAMGERGKGEEVRGYGNRRAEPLLAALSRYDESLAGFFAAWAIEVRPIGARANPIPM